MGILKSIAAFILGVVALLLFYCFVSIPILPSISVFVVGSVFNDGSNAKLRNVLIGLFGLLSVALYGANTYLMIRLYPEYGNVLGIIFGCVTTLAFFSATLANLIKNNYKETVST